MNVPHRLSRTALSCLCLGAALSVTACGDDGPDVPTPESVPPGAIAVVGEQPIPKATYERALAARTEGISPLDGNVVPAQPVEEPPYLKCIGQSGKEAKKALGEIPPRAQLKAGCVQKYELAKQVTIAMLIDEQWVIQAASEAGAGVPVTELKDQLEQYSGGAGNRRYSLSLKRSGLTLDDLRTQLEARLARQNLTEGETASEQVERRNDLQSDWRPKTLCADGFIVAQCSNGPELEDLPVPG